MGSGNQNANDDNIQNSSSIDVTSSNQSLETNFLDNLLSQSEKPSSEKNNKPVLPGGYHAQELHNYYDSIIACMPNNVYWLNTNCVLLGGNENLAKMFGVTRAELVGLTYEQMSNLAQWTEGQGETFKKIEQEVMASGIPRLNIEEPPVIINNKVRYFISNKVPLYNLQHEIIGVVGISIDITEQKLAEKRLTEEKEKSEVANNAKTQFLENMRHDLRTPLVGIRNFANVIKNETTDPIVQNHLNGLIYSSQALLELVNEILDSLKINTGEIPHLQRKFSLQKRLMDVIKLNSARASEKNIELLFEYDKTIPSYIISDPIRIHRVVLELVSNALKFTQQGIVKLTTSLAKKQGRDLVIKICVEDTGIGIARNHQDEVFLQFNRLSPSFKGAYKGSGCGLTIVKKFLEEIQGEIYLESEEGIGTKFTCLIPVIEPLLDDDFGSEKEMERETAEVSIFVEPLIYNEVDGEEKTNKVLLVEDQPIAAFATRSLIQGIEKGIQVDIAADGQTVINLASKNKYKVIFMDIGLPDMTGFEVATEIRRNEIKSKTVVPIIALTAHMDINDEKSLNNDINVVLIKPIDEKDIKKILNEVLVN